MTITAHGESPLLASLRSTRHCRHRRMIDDVLTPQGEKTGQVRCIECGAVFDDPTDSVKEEVTVERSIAMRQIYLSLMILGWCMVPNFVSADWSPYSQRHRTDHHTVDRDVIERDSLIHRVEFPTFHDAFGLTLGKGRDTRESERDHGSDSAISGKGIRSYDTPLSPSFDIPDSVDGHSDRPDPWWGSRTQGEPMLKDMRDMNRDPMRSP